MTSFDLDPYNISLINCNKLFEDTISVCIYDDIYKYELQDKKLSNINSKRIFFHHVIFYFCEAILKNNSGKKAVLFFNDTQLENCILNELYSTEEIIKTIMAVLNRMKSTLPVKTYISKYSLTYFKHLLETNQGKGHMLRNDITTNTFKKYEKYTFSKVKDFTKRYELTWLNQEYFNRLSTKFLLIR